MTNGLGLGQAPAVEEIQLSYRNTNRDGASSRREPQLSERLIDQIKSHPN
jgi:hypothetical protein